MKKILILVILGLIGRWAYTDYIWKHLTDKRLAKLVAAENENYPKEIKGAVIEKFELEPGLRIIYKVRFPVSSKTVDPSRIPSTSEFACQDKDGRHLLDHGVTLIFVSQDKDGVNLKKEVVKRSNC